MMEFSLSNDQPVVEPITTVQPETTTKRKRVSKYEDYPIVLGTHLRELMNNAGVTNEDVTNNYYTSKGQLLSLRALTRYQNVTMRDVQGGKAYPRGIPIRFITWLGEFIDNKQV